mgnify:CR=1 FL=1
MNRYIVVYEHTYKRAATLASYVVTAESEEDALEKIKNGEGEQTQEEFIGGNLSEDTVRDITNIGIG